MAIEDRVTYFGRTTHRVKFTRFGIKRRDRLSHIYVIGKTGTGKSTLLETLIRQDLENGEGLALLDPHGDLVERIAAAVPAHRQRDLIYFDVPDVSQPYGYNPLRRLSRLRRSLAASGMLEVFHKMWGERAWGQRMEHVLRNALLALLDQPRATLADLPRLLSEKRFRREVILNIENDQVRRFWQVEYERYSFRYQADAVAPVLNKVGAFLADPRLLRILTEPERPLSLRRIMDAGGILLVNLATGRIGEDSSSLLGGLLVTSIGLAAFSRADLPAAGRRDFYLYADEFQHFTTLSLVNMLSELRKFHVGAVLAHQYLHQLDSDIRHAVLGNAGTLISFRVGGNDAPYLAHEFEPKLDAVDFLNLPNHHIYLRLMIDGGPSQPFSAVTLEPFET